MTLENIYKKESDLMNYRKELKNTKRLVVKLGTSTLTHPNGKLNFGRIDLIARILSDLKNMGLEIVLVTSGAIGTGTIRLGMKEKPSDLPGKQAAAAIGQAALMRIYEKFFQTYDQVVAQALITKSVLDNPHTKNNAENTFNRLLEWGTIPIVNENDTIATDEIEAGYKGRMEFGDNDTLSATVAALINADLLVLMSDIDGLFTADPRKDPKAKILRIVEKIDDEIEDAAEGTGSDFGTGGMVTKIRAAKICKSAGISTLIMNGDSPELLYAALDGFDIGTLFPAKA